MLAGDPPSPSFGVASTPASRTDSPRGSLPLQRPRSISAFHGEGIAIPASFDIRASSFLFRYPRFNLVTKYFVDKSRQDWCSELERSSSEVVRDWRVVNRFDDSPTPLLNDATHVIRYEIFYGFNYRLIDLSYLCCCACHRCGPTGAHTQGAAKRAAGKIR